MLTQARAQQLHDNLLAAVARGAEHTVAFIAHPTVVRQLRAPLPWPERINQCEFSLHHGASDSPSATLEVLYAVIDGSELRRSRAVWQLARDEHGRWRVAAIRAMT